LNCYAPAKLPQLRWGGSFLPTQLMSLPVRMPPSARFFISLHALLALIYAALALVNS
jgi:hypothetical protein